MTNSAGYIGTNGSNIRNANAMGTKQEKLKQGVRCSKSEEIINHKKRDIKGNPNDINYKR